MLGCAVEAFDPDGKPCPPGVQGELVRHRADAVDAGRLLGRPTGEKLRAAYFSDYPGRVAPRRLDHLHRRRRVRDLGSVRRHAQPRRRAPRHERLLRRGRGPARGRRQPRRPPRRRRPRRRRWASCCCSSRSRPGAELDDDLRTAIATRAAHRAVAPPRARRDPSRCPSVPRTLSGKKLEVPVKRILGGAAADAVASRSSLADPDRARLVRGLRRFPLTRRHAGTKKFSSKLGRSRELLDVIPRPALRSHLARCALAALALVVGFGVAALPGVFGGGAGERATNATRGNPRAIPTGPAAKRVTSLPAPVAAPASSETPTAPAATPTDAVHAFLRAEAAGDFAGLVRAALGEREGDTAVASRLDRRARAAPGRARLRARRGARHRRACRGRQRGRAQARARSRHRARAGHRGGDLGRARRGRRMEGRVQREHARHPSTWRTTRRRPRLEPGSSRAEDADARARAALLGTRALADDLCGARRSGAASIRPSRWSRTSPPIRSSPRTGPRSSPGHGSCRSRPRRASARSWPPWGRTGA